MLNALSDVASRRPAFTLIELLVVLSIVLILGGLTVGVLPGVRNAQARAQAQAEIVLIAQGLEQFKVRYGDYPWISSTKSTQPSKNPINLNATKLFHSLWGWMALEENSSGTLVMSDLTKPGERFIDPMHLNFQTMLPSADTPPSNTYLVDPWGNAYVYAYNKSNAGCTWDNFGYVLYSQGPDGACVEVDAGGRLTDAVRDASKNRDNIYSKW